MSKPLYQTIYEDLKHQSKQALSQSMTHCLLKKNYQLPIVLVRSRSKKHWIC